jgi:CBS domain-containing protein
MTVRTRLVGEVMTTPVVSTPADASCGQVADLLVRHGIGAVPVVNDQGRVLGVVSEADLLPLLSDPDGVPAHPLVSRRGWEGGHVRDGRTAGELMHSPAETVAASTPLVVAARQLADTPCHQLPVLDDQDRLVGIVSRRDLLRLYTRADAAIRAELAELLADALDDPAAVQVSVRHGVAILSGAVPHPSVRRLIGLLAATPPSVVHVLNRLTVVDVPPAAGSHRGSSRVGLPTGG